jgi:nucleotide-binding universal stress UspA family protein
MPRTIIVPIDLSQKDAGAKALAQAKKYDREGRFILLHVTEPAQDYAAVYIAANLPDELLESRVDEAKKELKALAEQIGVASEAAIVVRTGHPGREILSYAEEVSADLIFIASHDPRWGDFLLGSVAAFVVRHAHCSVFVVREQGGERA